MRRLLIIARREYLSYVATVGFWISLGMVPLFMSAGFIMQAVMQRAAPERAYSVIADDPRVTDALEAVLAERRSEETEAALTALAAARGGPDAAEAVSEALSDGATPQEAARAAGLDAAIVEEAQAAVRRNYRRVPAPSQSEADIRPYLTGERPVPGWEGRGPLHAAIFVRRGDSGRYEVDYWSANLTNTGLRSAAVQAAARVMREDALIAAGIDPDRVEQATRARPVVRDLSPEKEEGAEEVTLADRLPFIVGIGAGFVLWTVIFSVVNMLLTSTIEEKSNKILEVLLSSARLPEILAGKLAGVAGVSLTLLAVWGAAGVAVLTLIAASSPDAAGPALDILGALVRPELIVPFLFYFVCGYLIYGAIFLAVGSLCETMQEAQTLMSPMILILMAPIILMGSSIGNLDSPLISGAAWFPLFTPFLMMARLPQDPPMYQVIGTSVLMLATLAFMIWAGSRVFRAGALGQARPGSLMKALRQKV